MRFLCSLALIALCATVAPARAFDFSDARHVVSLAQPQISPDGTRIVYIRGVSDFAKDHTDRQLWLLDVRTRAKRQLTWDRKGVSDPSW
jgi:Tol biopolymer transport system component